MTITNRRRPLQVLAAAGLALIASGPASAQTWEYFVLPPTGANHVVLAGTHAGVQAGYQTISAIAQSRGAVWNGTSPAGFVDIHPVGATSSYIWGSDGARHVGQFSWDGSIFRAGLWTGTSSQPIDLHLPQYLDTSAAATDGSQQVGVGYFGPGEGHALLWTGSAASGVNLNPAGAFISFASGVAVGRQVGMARIGGADRAGYWTGSAASWLSLDPGAPYAASQAHGISPDGQTQVGHAYRSGITRACLWHGTAASFVDLHPDGVGSNWSWAVAADGEYQVGFVDRPANQAAIWKGTRESYFNLHSVLAAGQYYYSSATGISQDSTGVWVSGHGMNLAGTQVGILWHLAEACPPDCDGSGTLNVNDYICFQTRFALGDPYADCDNNGVRNVNDYICFQTRFALGC